MKQVIDLLGKKVSFIEIVAGQTVQILGTVTDVILNINGNHQISVNDGDYYVLSELLEFQKQDTI